MYKKFLIFFILINLLSFNANSLEQFNFNVTEIEITNDGNTFKGSNRGTITTNDGIVIDANNFIYDKLTNILNASGKVKIEDTIQNYIIYADDITYFRNEEKIVTKGKSKAIDNTGQIISADNFTYDKPANILNANGKVKIEDKIQDYIIYAEDINYLRNEEKIITEGSTKANISSQYKIISKNVFFLRNEGILKSKNKTEINDQDSQIYFLDEFDYSIRENLLKGVNILIITNYEKPKSDKFFFSDALINLNKKTFVAKDTKITLHKDIFDRSDNDPRIHGVSSKNVGDKTIINKGVFTSCKLNEKCPPWSISAEKIEHSKSKKRLTYSNAYLRIYDLPILYIPKYFHPDPTVKRQSGLLKPEINHSKILGSSITLPYYFDLADNKDYTLTPTWFDNKFLILQNEYRQSKNNYNFLTDFGYVRDYKPSSSTNREKKNFGHFFTKLNLDLDLKNFISSKLDLKINKVTNDSYLKIFENHITKSQTKPDDLNLLNNSIKLTLNHDKYNFKTGFETYEKLDEKKSDRFQYIMPYYDFDKIISNNFFNGTLSLNSSGKNDLNNTNVLETTFTNDLNYKSKNFISNLGFKNNFNIYSKNFNSIGRNSSKYKSTLQSEVINLYNATLSYPLIQINKNNTSYITPKFSINLNPSDMKDHSSSIKKMDAGSLFNINRLGLTDSFESGESLTLGLDFRKESNLDEINKYFEFKVATVMRAEEENFIPKTSTLNKKNSNIFGSIDTKISENLNFKYNFAVDNNLSTFENNNLDMNISLNNLVTTFSFIEENGEMGDTNVFANSIGYKIDENNFISFKTRRNRKINLTEYYDLVYEYKNDCLTAAIKYKKTYYQDADIKPEENLLFTLTLFPLTTYEYSAEELLNEK